MKKQLEQVKTDIQYHILIIKLPNAYGKNWPVRNQV